MTKSEEITGLFGRIYKDVFNHHRAQLTRVPEHERAFHEQKMNEALQLAITYYEVGFRKVGVDVQS